MVFLEIDNYTLLECFLSSAKVKALHLWCVCTFFFDLVFWHVIFVGLRHSSWNGRGSLQDWVHKSMHLRAALQNWVLTVQGVRPVMTIGRPPPCHLQWELFLWTSFFLSLSLSLSVSTPSWAVCNCWHPGSVADSSSRMSASGYSVFRLAQTCASNERILPWAWRCFGLKGSNAGELATKRQSRLAKPWQREHRSTCYVLGLSAINVAQALMRISDEGLP